MTPHNDDTRPRRAGVRQGVGVGTRQDWQRLGALMRARRGQMGYQYRNRFAAARAQQLGAGPLSTKNMIEIEEPPPKRKPGSWMTETLERIAAFYDTTAASMLRVVRGDADQLDWVARAGDTAGPGPGPMTDPERQQAAWPYASRIWQDIPDAEAAARALSTVLDRARAAIAVDRD